MILVHCRGISQIFNAVNTRKDAGESIQITVSFLEIYQETGYDLLKTIPSNGPGPSAFAKVFQTESTVICLFFYSYLHNRTAVRGGAGTPQVPCTAVRSRASTPQVPCTAVRSRAEIDRLSLRLRVFRGESLGDFLLAPVCPIEKVTLLEGLLYLMLGFNSDEGVVKDNVLV